MNVLVAEKAREDVNFLTHINTILIIKSFKRLGTNDLFVAIFYLIKKKRRLILFNNAWPDLKTII